MIILLYIFLSYMIMLGMILESYPHSDNVPYYMWFMWLLSPFVFPIILGMEIVSKNKN